MPLRETSVKTEKTILINSSGRTRIRLSRLCLDSKRELNSIIQNDRSREDWWLDRYQQLNLERSHPVRILVRPRVQYSTSQAGVPGFEPGFSA